MKNSFTNVSKLKLTIKVIIYAKIELLFVIFSTWMNCAI